MASVMESVETRNALVFCVTQPVACSNHGDPLTHGSRRMTGLMPWRCALDPRLSLIWLNPCGTDSLRLQDKHRRLLRYHVDVKVGRWEHVYGLFLCVRLFCCCCCSSPKHRALDLSCICCTEVNESLQYPFTYIHTHTHHPSSPLSAVGFTAARPHNECAVWWWTWLWNHVVSCSFLLLLHLLCATATEFCIVFSARLMHRRLTLRIVDAAVKKPKRIPANSTRHIT